MIRPVIGHRSRLVGGMKIARHLRADKLDYAYAVVDDLIFDMPPELLRDRMEDKNYGVKFSADFVDCELDDLQRCEGAMIADIELTCEGVVITLDDDRTLMLRGSVVYLDATDKIESDKSYRQHVTTTQANEFSIRRRDSPEKYMSEDEVERSVRKASGRMTYDDIMSVAASIPD